MVSTATIKIKRGRSADNGSGGQNIDKEMLKELKNMSNIFSRAAKLQQSGLGGGGAGGLGGVSGLLGELAAPIIGGVLAGVKTLDVGSQVLNRAENLERGEAFKLGEGGNVDKVDVATGDLIETIDKQDAIEKGILDNRGELLDIYEESNKSAKEFVSNLEIYNEDSSPLFNRIINGIKNMVSSMFNVEENLQSFAESIKQAEEEMQRKAKSKLRADFDVDPSLDFGPTARSPFIKAQNGQRFDATNFNKPVASNTKVRG